MTMLFAATFTAGCLGRAADGALFSDVSKAPPMARPATIEAIEADRPFGEWVIYQARACERWGCSRSP